MTGRTSRLRINTWSTRILDPVRVEGLGGEGTDDLTGYRSLLHGGRPGTQQERHKQYSSIRNAPHHPHRM